MEKTAPITCEPWRLFLGAGLLLGVGYLLIPDAATRNLVYNPINTLVVLTSAATVLYGVRKHRPVRKLPWFLLALALLAFAAGDATITVYENVLSIKTPFPSIADAFYLAVYPLFFAGLLMARSLGSGPRDSANLIDAMIFVLGFSVLGLVHSIEPYAIEPVTTIAQQITGIAYVFADLLLILGIISFILKVPIRSVSMILLILSPLLLLLMDVSYTATIAAGFYEPGSLLDVGWLVFPILVGAAALHPSMATLYEASTIAEPRLTRWRLSLLTAASLATPGALALQAWRDLEINTPLIVGGSVLSFLLVIARLVGITRAQERAMNRETVMNETGAALIQTSRGNDALAVALKSMTALIKNVPGASAHLWHRVGDHLIAAHRASDNAQIELQELPSQISSSLLRGLPHLVTPENAARLSNLLGFSSEVDQVFVLPLQTYDGLMGIIVVSCREPLPLETQNSLKTLSSQISLTLQYLQMREEMARQAGTIRERHRLAREIHDSLAQGLTSIVMNLSLEQIARRSAGNSDSTTSRVDLALQTARESLAEARLFIEDLRPKALDKSSLADALTQLAERTTREATIEVEAIIIGSSHPLPPDVETALLRISQEAVANIRKHARASRAVITLSFIEGVVTLDIIDNGMGFDYEATINRSHSHDGSGFGLASMQDRAVQIGAAFSIDSTLGMGTTVAVEITITPDGRLA